MKEKYIQLLRKRSYLMETKHLYNSHYEEIAKIDKEIEEINK